MTTTTKKRKAKLGREIPAGLARFGRSQLNEVTPAPSDPDGGKNGAGLISGVSLATVGEALGHGMWLDSETLSQIVSFANDQATGLKSRFTHPSMSSDGLGRHLGRIHDVEMSADGTQVFGDLHFAQLAHNTPDGDLAEYVMGLADQDPEAAGLSIVFDYDEDSMIEFALAHGAVETKYGIDWDEFESPDPLNTENYPHVRMSVLRAADVVDEPAANEAGLFDRISAPRDADKFLAFASGISDHHPGKFLGVDPDRAREFFARFCESHGLSFSSIEKEPEQMTTATDQPNPTPETAPADPPSREDFAAELSRYTESFGAENGSKWFQEGVSFSDAQQRHSDALAAENEDLRAQLDEANAKLDSVQLGEEEPIAVGGEPKNSRITFDSFFGNSEN